MSDDELKDDERPHVPPDALVQDLPLYQTEADPIPLNISSILYQPDEAVCPPPIFTQYCQATKSYSTYALCWAEATEQDEAGLVLYQFDPEQDPSWHAICQLEKPVSQPASFEPRQYVYIHQKLYELDPVRNILYELGKYDEGQQLCISDFTLELVPRLSDEKKGADDSASPQSTGARFELYNATNPIKAHGTVGVDWNDIPQRMRRGVEYPNVSRPNAKGYAALQMIYDVIIEKRAKTNQTSNFQTCGHPSACVEYLAPIGNRLLKKDGSTWEPSLASLLFPRESHVKLDSLQATVSHLCKNAYFCIWPVNAERYEWLETQAYTQCEELLSRVPLLISVDAQASILFTQSFAQGTLFLAQDGKGEREFIFYTFNGAYFLIPPGDGHHPQYVFCQQEPSAEDTFWSPIHIYYTTEKQPGMLFKITFIPYGVMEGLAKPSYQPAYIELEQSGLYVRVSQEGAFLRGQPLGVDYEDVDSAFALLNLGYFIALCRTPSKAVKEANALFSFARPEQLARFQPLFKRRYAPITHFDVTNAYECLFFSYQPPAWELVTLFYLSPRAEFVRWYWGKDMAMIVQNRDHHALNGTLDGRLHHRFYLQDTTGERGTTRTLIFTDEDYVRVLGDSSFTLINDKRLANKTFENFGKPAELSNNDMLTKEQPCLHAFWTFPVRSPVGALVPRFNPTVYLLRHPVHQQQHVNRDTVQVLFEETNGAVKQYNDSPDHRALADMLRATVKFAYHRANKEMIKPRSGRSADLVISFQQKIIKKEETKIPKIAVLYQKGFKQVGWEDGVANYLGQLEIPEDKTKLNFAKAAQTLAVHIPGTLALKDEHLYFHSDSKDAISILETFATFTSAGHKDLPTNVFIFRVYASDQKVAATRVVECLTKHMIRDMGVPVDCHRFAFYVSTVKDKATGKYEVTDLDVIHPAWNVCESAYWGEGNASAVHAITYPGTTDAVQSDKAPLAWMVKMLDALTSVWHVFPWMHMREMNSPIIPSPLVGNAKRVPGEFLEIKVAYEDACAEPLTRICRAFKLKLTKSDASPIQLCYYDSIEHLKLDLKSDASLLGQRFGGNKSMIYIFVAVTKDNYEKLSKLKALPVNVVPVPARQYTCSVHTPIRHSPYTHLHRVSIAGNDDQVANELIEATKALHELYGILSDQYEVPSYFLPPNEEEFDEQKYIQEFYGDAGPPKGDLLNDGDQGDGGGGMEFDDDGDDAFPLGGGWESPLPPIRALSPIPFPNNPGWEGKHAAPGDNSPPDNAVPDPSSLAPFVLPPVPPPTQQGPSLQDVMRASAPLPDAKEEEVDLSSPRKVEKALRPKDPSPDLMRVIRENGPGGGNFSPSEGPGFEEEEEEEADASDTGSAPAAPIPPPAPAAAIPPLPPAPVPATPVPRSPSPSVTVQSPSPRPPATPDTLENAQRDEDDIMPDDGDGNGGNRSDREDDTEEKNSDTVSEESESDDDASSAGQVDETDSDAGSRTDGAETRVGSPHQGPQPVAQEIAPAPSPLPATQLPVIPLTQDIPPPVVQPPVDLAPLPPPAVKSPIPAPTTRRRVVSSPPIKANATPSQGGPRAPVTRTSVSSSPPVANPSPVIASASSSSSPSAPTPMPSSSSSSSSSAVSRKPPAATVVFHSPKSSSSSSSTLIRATPAATPAPMPPGNPSEPKFAPWIDAMPGYLQKTHNLLLNMLMSKKRIGDEEPILLCYSKGYLLQEFAENFIRTYGMFPGSIELCKIKPDERDKMKMKNVIFVEDKEAHVNLMRELSFTFQESSCYLSQTMDAEIFNSPFFANESERVAREDTQTCNALESAVDRSGAAEIWCATFLHFPLDGVSYFIELSRCINGKAIAMQLTEWARHPLFSDVDNLFYIRDLLAFIYFGNLMSRETDLVLDKVLHASQSQPRGPHKKAFSPRCMREFFNRCGSVELDKDLYERKIEDVSGIISLRQLIQVVTDSRNKQDTQMIPSNSIPPLISRPSDFPFSFRPIDLALLVSSPGDNTVSASSGTFAWALMDTSGKTQFESVTFKSFMVALVVSKTTTVSPMCTRDRIDFADSLARTLPAEYFIHVTPATRELIAYACTSATDQQLTGVLLKAGTQANVPVGMCTRLRRMIFIANAFLGTGPTATREYTPDERGVIGLSKRRRHHRSVRFPEVLAMLRRGAHAYPDGDIIKHLSALELEFDLIQDEWEMEYWKYRFRIMKLALFCHARDHWPKSSQVPSHMIQCINVGLADFFGFQPLADLYPPDGDDAWVIEMTGQSQFWKENNAASSPKFLAANQNLKWSRRDILTRVHLLCDSADFGTTHRPMGSNITAILSDELFPWKTVRDYIRHAANGYMALVGCSMCTRETRTDILSVLIDLDEHGPLQFITFWFSPLATHLFVHDQPNQHLTYRGRDTGFVFDIMTKEEEKRGVLTEHEAHYALAPLTPDNVVTAWSGWRDLIRGVQSDQVLLCDLRKKKHAKFKDSHYSAIISGRPDLSTPSSDVRLICDDKFHLTPDEVDAVCRFISVNTTHVYTQTFIFTDNATAQDQRIWSDAITGLGRVLLDDPRHRQALAKYRTLDDVVTVCPIVAIE